MPFWALLSGQMRAFIHHMLPQQAVALKLQFAEPPIHRRVLRKQRMPQPIIARVAPFIPCNRWKE